ncbi:DNA topoisomerase IV [Gilvibacter sediminis]|uniref:DNA topoisomerase IV n=1 Tax=Gilvibacter sediminis TaxID=379071 RepID=UPI002350AED3|nr:DNA topoisomerase IV [Gilvibacter sediminis]MDC7998254.1 DNA topoisomerase IV [Gilvibacter sediminis]
MKKIVLLSLVFSLVFACQEPERRCPDFKTGTFTFEEFVGGELKQTTFVRNDSIEIDYYDQTIDTFSIRWINDCEYIMKNLRPKNQSEERPVHFKILKTEGDTYTFEYSMVIKKNKASKRYVRQGTAKKVSEATSRN